MGFHVLVRQHLYIEPGPCELLRSRISPPPPPPPPKLISSSNLTKSRLPITYLSVAQSFPKVCTEHGSESLLPCSEFPKNLTTVTDNVDERDFARFEFTMSRWGRCPILEQPPVPWCPGGPPENSQQVYDDRCNDLLQRAEKSKALEVKGHWSMAGARRAMGCQRAWTGPWQNSKSHAKPFWLYLSLTCVAIQRTCLCSHKKNK